MPHRNYTTADFDSTNKQRNIMAFVGNGFDLQVMHDYNSPTNTRYESFYYYLKFISFDKDNLIYSRMKMLREQGKDNWSDIEESLTDIIYEGEQGISKLKEDLAKIQEKFADFLDTAVPATLPVQLGADSMNNKLAINSLLSFIGDLSKDQIKKHKFNQNSSHYDIYNFMFVNFNYTSLLDNYMYLDQVQFDPLPFNNVDRNFTFQVNPAGHDGIGIRPGDNYSSYLVTDLIHPHGSQGIPRSLLLGTDTPPGLVNNQDQKLRLSKPFWAQNKIRYQHLFEDTELYIIFGCSLGQSDKWWWKNIANSLNKDTPYTRRTENYNGLETFKPEVIIYWYDSELTTTEEYIRRKFLEVASMPERYDELEEYIQVIVYNEDSRRVWLNTKRQSS